MRALLSAISMTVLSVAPTSIASTDSTTILPEDHTALDAVTNDLCGRQVVLLSEAPTHGDGHTAAFKVASVRQLLTRCQFNALLFEGSRYEFIALNRALRRGRATGTMLSDAVGGLWKFDREFQPLTPFLLARARAGRLRLAGLDGPVGGLEEPYANERMVPELAEGLDRDRRDACQAAFARHIAWSYAPARPYGAPDHDRLLGCVALMQDLLDTHTDVDPATRAERQAMLDNLRWAIEPDLSIDTVRVSAREQAMFRNVLAVEQTLPPRSKIIIWGATVHLARSAAAVPRFARVRTLGALVHQRHGDGAFSLGFSSVSGAYRSFRTRLPIEAPPVSSLEAAASTFGAAGTIYLGRSRLSRLGTTPGAVLDHAYRPADWSGILDGVVIFRREWPTHGTRPGYS